MKTMEQSLPCAENVLKTKLENGLTVLIRENEQSPSVTISGYLPCGSFLDPAEKTGLAGLAAMCLMSGTRRHHYSEISEMVEASGASLNFNVTPRKFSFSGRCLAEDLPMLLHLLLEVIDEPTFPPERVELMRRMLLTAFEVRRHEADDMASLTFNRALFGDHPYGHEDGGTRETIQRVSCADLQNFQRHYCGPEGMRLCIVGGIERQKTLELVRSVFGNWGKLQEKLNEASFFKTTPPPQLARRLHYEIPEKPEMSLISGTLGPKRSSPLYHSALLGNCILGEFGMMGRIGRVVRDENGLAYYAGSSLRSLKYGGSWLVSASVNAANLEQALNLIHTELRRFITTPVEAEELSDVKSYYIGSLPLSLESNAGMANAILTLESFDLDPDYFLGLTDRINAVTADSILEAARTFIDPEKMLTVTAGTTEPGADPV